MRGIRMENEQTVPSLFPVISPKSGPGSGSLNVPSIAMHSNGNLYSGTEAGVFVSTTDCASWAALNTGMP